MKTTEATAVLRNLNDYESMLAPMTCNVGMDVQILGSKNHGECEAAIKQAWRNTVARYQCLQVCLEALKGEGAQGALGQRYALVKKIDGGGNHADAADITIHHQHHDRHLGDEEKTMPSLLGVLQEHGTTKVDWLRSSYNLEVFKIATTQSDGESVTIKYRIVLCMCHSVSDGPGTLAVAGYFLRQLGRVIADGSHRPEGGTECLKCIDLQAQILGHDYGAADDKVDCFVGADEALAALGSPDMKLEDGSNVLPPEAMQGISKPDEGANASGAIEAISIELKKEETSRLLTNCKANQATIQGALNAAYAVVRLALLKHELPCSVPLQIPMNCRRLAPSSNATELADSCLCGSAGLWQILAVAKNDRMLSGLATKSSESMRAGANDGQPKEWLRRLFNDPATMPPYGLMMSSIGVAPVTSTYGDDSVAVEDLIFFGGSKRPAAPSGNQATMAHVQTFDGRLHLTFNHVGVDFAFARRTADAIDELLRVFAGDEPDITVAEAMGKIASITNN